MMSKWQSRGQVTAMTFLLVCLARYTSKLEVSGTSKYCRIFSTFPLGSRATSSNRTALKLTFFRSAKFKFHAEFSTNIICFKKHRQPFYYLQLNMNFNGHFRWRRSIIIVSGDDDFAGQYLFVGKTFGTPQHVEVKNLDYYSSGCHGNHTS